MKFVVAQVERRVDGLERFEIQVHLLLFALVRHDRTAVDHQPVRGYSRVQSALACNETCEKRSKIKGQRVQLPGGNREGSKMKAARTFRRDHVTRKICFLFTIGGGVIAGGKVEAVIF